MPHDKPYSVHQFNFHGMMLLYFFASTHQQPDESRLPLLVSFSVTKSLLILKVFSLSLPSLCVPLSYFSLSSQTFVLILLGLHENESSSLSLSLAFCSSFSILAQLLPFTTSVCFTPLLCLNPICTAVVSPISHPHYCRLCPSLPAPPSFFVCFSLAVWICPSPNRLSHLNDGCLRLN